MNSSIYIRFLRWGLNKIGLYSLGALCLLCVIFGALVAGINKSAYYLEDVSFLLITMLGLLVGWWLGGRNASYKKLAVLAVSLGVLYNWLHVGKMGGRLYSLVRALIQLVSEAFRRGPDSPPLDFSLALIFTEDLGLATREMAVRLVLWLGGALSGSSGQDLIATTLVWGLALWAVAAWAGWVVRCRRDSLWAIIPAGVMGAASSAYSRLDSGYLLPFIGGALLLMSWTNYFRRQHEWQISGTDYAEDINFDMVVWTLTFVGGIIATSLLLSQFSPQKAVDSLRRLARGTGGTVFQGGEPLDLEANEGTRIQAQTNPPPGILPREHLLGSGPDLEHKVVMVVRVLGDEPASLEERQKTFHWQALNYDLYGGRGWSTSSTERLLYPAKQGLDEPVPSSRQIVNQEIQILGSAGAHVYSAGRLVSVDQDYWVEWRQNNEYKVDIFGATLDNVEQALIYRASSSLAALGEEQLRSAGLGYPQWVLDRYLQLPEELPTQVVDLALEITEDAGNPYDQALALESYLRTYPYSLDVPEPPPDRDVVEYFLFDLQRGYCDYYATAMVVMARAAQIPARLVMGYASGDYQASQRSFVVTEADAHSWVEIYFPSVGWVEFEPTGGRPAIDRLDNYTPPVNAVEDGGQYNVAPWRWRLWLNWFLWIVGSIFGLILLVLLWLLSDTWRMRYLSPGEASKGLYQRLYRNSQRLEVVVAPGQTPHEFIVSFAKQVETLASKRWARFLSPGAEEARQLVELYTRTIYSQQHPDMGEQLDGIKIWARLRRRLVLLFLVHIWRARWQLHRLVQKD